MGEGKKHQWLMIHVICYWMLLCYETDALEQFLELFFATGK
jgi:hypothetical protein